MKKTIKEQPPFLKHVLHDTLSGIKGISHRAMFGGYGIYKDGIIFAIIAEDKLYFKVDDSNREDYEKHGSQPFVYEQGKHQRISMSYWELPPNIMKDKQKISRWIQASYQINRQRKDMKS